MIERVDLSELAAYRDARVAAAREKLFAASDEAARRIAVLEELRAKLDFERETVRQGLGSTPAIAARVLVGELSINDAVLIEQANGEPSASDLASELSPIATADQWVNFEARTSSNPRERRIVIERLCEARDRVGALRVLSLEPLDGSDVVYVARVFGRDAVSAFRDAAFESIALIEALRNEDPWYYSAKIAEFTNALTCEEQRERVVEIAEERLRSNVDQAFARTISRTAATIAVALLDVGEMGVAMRWIEELVFTERFEPIGRCFDYAHRPVIAALREHSSPEEYAVWEQRLRTLYQGKTGIFAALHTHVSEAWRDELIPVIRATIDPVRPVLSALPALSREQQRAYVHHKLRRGKPTSSRRAFAQRLEDHPAFEEALLAWRPRLSSARKRGESYEPLSTLLDAAADNNAAAIDALCHWSDPDEVIAVPQFSLGLAPEVVRKLLDRSTRAPRLGKDVVARSNTLIAIASPEARERWQREWGVHAPDKREDAAQTEARWRSRANDEDAETLASGSSWSDRGAEAAYRALIRCVAIRLAQRDEDEPRRALQRVLLERVEDYNFERWERAIIAAIRECFAPAAEFDRDRFEATIGRVLRARPDAMAYATDAMLSDCFQLAIADAVIAIVAEVPWIRLRAATLCALIPLASEASRVAAVETLRESFRASEELRALPTLVPFLTVSDLLARWSSVAGTTSLGLLDAPLLTKVGGSELVDRVGDMLVELLSDASLVRATPPAA